MKTLYLECNMGAAGDMLMAALLELVEDKDAFLRRINSLGIGDIRVSAEKSVKCGITGTHVSVTIEQGIEETSVDVDLSAEYAHSHDNEHNHDNEHSRDHGHGHSHGHEHNHAHEHDHSHERNHSHKHDHSHSDMASIETRIDSLPIPKKVKDDIIAVYKLIAEAEAHVHGRAVSEVHFHEVGNLDAIADIVGVCLLLKDIAPDKIIVSPVHVGNGFVKCAHGVLPVPAPATAHILRDVPAYGGRIKGELCTPTGAALLKRFADDFGSMPEMKIQKIGYGMGKKDFEAANCVRAFLGEEFWGEGGPNGQVAELCCNIDDMSGEALGFACQTLMNAGARDVFTAPVGMKKDRPGVLLTCVCDANKADMFAGLMLRYTTTFGIRKALFSRYTLDREIKTVQTPYGTVRIKTGRGYGVEKAKLEYDDIAELAREKSVSISEIERTIWAFLNDKGEEI